MKMNKVFNLESLEDQVEKGLISKRKHPECDLWIYNYTSKAAYARMWTIETLTCRGLILDAEGNVIARPFPKFFNLEEHSSSDIIFSRPYTAFEKLDGSLGIMYPLPDGGFAIASRGSFDSDHARIGTSLLRDMTGQGWEPNPDYTYLFEILFPENRIVVDYGDRKELVFLAAIHTETGANLFDFGTSADWPGGHAERYDFSDIRAKDLLDELGSIPNSEGFVLFFPTGNTRVKVKFDDYKRLHRIITGTNTKTVWRTLRDGQSLDELLDRVPDEFHEWLKTTIKQLETQYAEIEAQAVVEFDKIMSKLAIGADRGEFARYAKKTRLAPLMFAMLDKKNYSGIIWKWLEPRRSESFFNPSEEEI